MPVIYPEQFFTPSLKSYTETVPEKRIHSSPRTGERRRPIWLPKFLSCWLSGHTYLSLVYRGKAYQYCLQCGKVRSGAVVNTRSPEAAPVPGRDGHAATVT